MTRYRQRGDYFPLSAWTTLEAAEDEIHKLQRTDERDKVTCWVYKICDTNIIL